MSFPFSTGRNIFQSTLYRSPKRSAMRLYIFALLVLVCLALCAAEQQEIPAKGVSVALKSPWAGHSLVSQVTYVSIKIGL